jgi:hypothetical protein
LFIRFPPGPAPIVTFAREEPRRVVLDAQRLLAVDGLAADERVFALLELEFQEIGGVDELRPAGLREERVECRRRLLRNPLGLDIADLGAGPAALLDSLDLSLVARPRAAQVVLFVLAALALLDGDAVGLEGTAHEIPLLDEPRVLTLVAPDRQLRRPAHLDELGFVEDVLLEPLPVLVAPGDDSLHERVEIALESGRRGGSRQRDGGDPRRGENEGVQNRLDQGPGPPRQAQGPNLSDEDGVK